MSAALGRAKVSAPSYAVRKQRSERVLCRDSSRLRSAVASARLGGLRKWDAEGWDVAGRAA